MSISILRLPEVMARTGLSRSTIYLQIQKGIFPSPISLGARAVGWVDCEISALISARVAGKSEDEIRGLVSSMKLERKEPRNVDQKVDQTMPIYAHC